MLTLKIQGISVHENIHCFNTAPIKNVSNRILKRHKAMNLHGKIMRKTTKEYDKSGHTAWILQYYVSVPMNTLMRTKYCFSRSCCGIYLEIQCSKDIY